MTLVTALRDDPRLFAVERAGRIRILVNEQLTPVPFVDLSADASGPEGPSCHGSVFRLEVTKP